jgi:hypothetical protein
MVRWNKKTWKGTLFPPQCQHVQGEEPRQPLSSLGRSHGQVGPKSCHQMTVLQELSLNAHILSKLSAFFCKRSVLVPFRPTYSHIVDIGSLKVSEIFLDHENGH